MAYCTFETVRVYAPQADVGEDFDAYITQAGGVIDANLRGNYDLPLASVPQILVDVAGQLAAGYWLSAHYTKANQSVPQFARDLIEGAMATLLQIKTDRSMLDIDLKTPSADDLARNSVRYGQPSENTFDSSDELDW